MAQPLDGLDDVPWSELHVAYGNADDLEVPAILRRLGSSATSEVDEGWEQVNEQILSHQRTVYPGTVAAVPFLARLAASDRTHRRPRIIHYLAELSLGFDEPYSPAGTAARVRLAVCEASVQLRRHLSTPDIGLGLSMAWLASSIPEDFGDAATFVRNLRSAMPGTHARAALTAAACLLGDQEPDDLSTLREAQEQSVYTARVVSNEGGTSLIVVDDAARQGATGNGYERIAQTPVFDSITRWTAQGNPSEGEDYLDLLRTVYSMFMDDDEITDAVWRAP